MKRVRRQARRWGIVLITTLSIITFLVMLSTMLVTTAYNTLKRASYFYDNEQALHAALTGLAFAQGKAETDLMWMTPGGSSLNPIYPSYATVTAGNGVSVTVTQTSGMVIGIINGQLGKQSGFKICFDSNAWANATKPSDGEEVQTPPEYASTNNLTNGQSAGYTWFQGNQYHQVPMMTMGLIIEGFVIHPSSDPTNPNIPVKIVCKRYVEACFTNNYGSTVDSVAFSGNDMNIGVENGGNWSLSSVPGVNGHPGMRPMNNVALQANSGGQFNEGGGTIHLTQNDTTGQVATASVIDSAGNSSPLGAQTDTVSQDTNASRFPRLSFSSAYQSTGANTLPGGAYVYWDASKLAQNQMQVQNTANSSNTANTANTASTSSSGSGSVSALTSSSSTSSSGSGVQVQAHAMSMSMSSMSVQSVSAQSVSAQSVSAQSVSAQSVSAQSVSAQSVSAQSVQAQTAQANTTTNSILSSLTSSSSSSQQSGYQLQYYPDMNYSNTDPLVTFTFNADGSITETNNHTAPATVLVHYPAAVPPQAGNYFNSQQPSVSFDRAVEVTAGSSNSVTGQPGVNNLAILTANDPTTQAADSNRVAINMTTASGNQKALLYNSSGGVTMAGDLTGSGGIVTSGDISFQGHSVLSGNSNAGLTLYSAGNVNITPISTPQTPQQQAAAQQIQQAIQSAMGNTPFTVAPDQISQVANNVANALGNQLTVGSVTYDSRAISSMVQLMIQNQATKDVNGNYVVDPTQLQALTSQDQAFYGLIYAYKDIKASAGTGNSLAIQGALVAWGGDPSQYAVGNISTYPGQQAGYAGTGNVSLSGHSVSFKYDPNYLGPLAGMFQSQASLDKAYWATF